MVNRHSLTCAATLCLALALPGCSVGPDYVTPAAPEAGRYTTGPQPRATQASATTGGQAQVLLPGADVPGAWWTLFGSPEMTALVQQAIAHNPTVTAAQATLREAKETVRAEQGAFFPSVSASASRTREKASGGTSAQGLFSLYSASVDVSYTIDVFGGERRQVEQLRAQADYQRAELEATVVTLIANTIEAAVNEASLRAQVGATQEIIRIYTDELGVLQRRFALGGVSKADVLQQQASQAAAVATLPPLRRQAEQARHLLAVYVGDRPDTFTLATPDLDRLTLPATLPVSLPSVLVAHRPDIRAYAALVHSATAQVGVATANLLPQFTITGSYGSNATRIGDLFSPSGLVWSLATTLTQPLFEGGTLLARRREAVAALEVAAAQYSSTLNTAFQNVADSLVALQRDAEALHAQLDSVTVAGESLAVARAQLAAGGGTVLNVLTAEQAYQSARLQLVTAQATRFTDVVALLQSLGGGWWQRDDAGPVTDHCCGLIP